MTTNSVQVYKEERWIFHGEKTNSTGTEKGLPRTREIGLFSGDMNWGVANQVSRSDPSAYGKPASSKNFVHHINQTIYFQLLRRNIAIGSHFQEGLDHLVALQPNDNHLDKFLRQVMDLANLSERFRKKGISKYINKTKKAFDTRFAATISTVI